MDKQSTISLRTGSAMPVLGLGTWQLTKDTSETIKQALQLGYRMIDTSGDYGTQPDIGEGIRESSIDRNDLYIVTKVEEDEDSYQAAKKNLTELGLDYADLILIHRPPKSGAGEDLWEGLRRAKREGLTKDIGVSNYSIELLLKIINTGEAPVVNQIEWSPFGHSNEMFEFCSDSNIIVQAYSPLTRTEKLDDPTLVECAKNYAKTPAQILIRWNIQNGTVPLPKANRFTHLQENIDVFDFDISPEDMDKLDSLNEYFSSLGDTLKYL